MSRKHSLELNTYALDDKRNENPEKRKVSLYGLSKAIDPQTLATILDDYNNSFDNMLERGKKVGRELHRSHRTVQRNHVLFLLGVLSGLGEQYPDGWYDPRNEKAVETADKIRRMVEEGDLLCGPMV